MVEAATEQWTEEVLEQHRELNQMVSDLRLFLLQPRPDVGQKGCHVWAAELAARLVTLHDSLFRHFRFEEEGGMVEDVALRHPRASDAIDGIVAEHPVMLRELRRLMTATLTYSEGHSPEDPTLRGRVGKLLDCLEKHERNETELLQCLESQDLGAMD